MTTRTLPYVYSTTLTVTSCGDCRIGFAIPEDLYSARHQDGQSFYCPNGHRISWSETENARLARQLKAQQEYTARLNQRLTDEQNHSRALKGVATKLRNRVIAGECSFCGQHLHDLARHIARVHPDEKPEPFGGEQ